MQILLEIFSAICDFFYAVQRMKEENKQNKEGTSSMVYVFSVLVIVVMILFAMFATQQMFNQEESIRENKIVNNIHKHLTISIGWRGFLMYQKKTP